MGSSQSRCAYQAPAVGESYADFEKRRKASKNTNNKSRRDDEPPPYEDAAGAAVDALTSRPTTERHDTTSTVPTHTSVSSISDSDGGSDWDALLDPFGVGDIVDLVVEATESDKKDKRKKCRSKDDAEDAEQAAVLKAQKAAEKAQEKAEKAKQKAEKHARRALRKATKAQRKSDRCNVTSTVRAERAAAKALAKAERVRVSAYKKATKAQQRAERLAIEATTFAASPKLPPPQLSPHLIPRQVESDPVALPPAAHLAPLDFPAGSEAKSAAAAPLSPRRSPAFPLSPASFSSQLVNSAHNTALRSISAALSAPLPPIPSLDAPLPPQPPSPPPPPPLPPRRPTSSSCGRQRGSSVTGGRPSSCSRGPASPSSSWNRSRGSSSTSSASGSAALSPWDASSHTKSNLEREYGTLPRLPGAPTLVPPPPEYLQDNKTTLEREYENMVIGMSSANVNQ